MNNTIAPILKQLRKSSGLSIKQTASQLQHHGIAVASKTLYGYESGLSMPNADVFVALCKIYQQSSPASAAEIIPPLPNSLSGCTPLPATYSQDELSFLDAYKALDAFGKDIVRQILEHETERIRQSKACEKGQKQT